MNNGLEHPGVLDAMAHDTAEDRVILAMYAWHPWEGNEQQLFQLQEKLNAYLSFLLDGEMTEAFPQLSGKPVEIQLRTRFEPDARAADLMRRMREQLAFQKVDFVFVLTDEPEQARGQCGGSCGCHDHHDHDHDHEH